MYGGPIAGGPNPGGGGGGGGDLMLRFPVISLILSLRNKHLFSGRYNDLETQALTLIFFLDCIVSNPSSSHTKGQIGSLISMPGEASSTMVHCVVVVVVSVSQGGPGIRGSRGDRGEPGGMVGDVAKLSESRLFA